MPLRMGSDAVGTFLHLAKLWVPLKIVDVSFRHSEQKKGHLAVVHS